MPSPVYLFRKLKLYDAENEGAAKVFEQFVLIAYLLRSAVYRDDFSDRIEAILKVRG